MIARTAEISYATVIARVKMSLKLENTTDHDPYLILKADEAMRQINDLSMFEFRTETTPLTAGTAPLPCGLVRIVSLWFTDANGQRCTPAPYVHSEIANYCECDTSGCPLLLNSSYQINGNYIVFHSPTAMTASEVTVAFVGSRIDENRQPVIPETHDRAVQAYVKWRYREDAALDQDNAMKAQMMAAAAERNRQEFVNQKKYLQGLANQIHWLENKRNIGRQFNEWVGRRHRPV